MPTTTEKQDWRNERARLTRAVNSGDPHAVMLACEHFRDVYVPQYGMTDFWPRWEIAADDALSTVLRNSLPHGGRYPYDQPAVQDLIARLESFLRWIRFER